MFWAAFDMPMTVVPLKVALGWGTFDFWVFKNNNHDVTLDTHLCDYFFEMPKNQISPMLMQLLMVPLSWAYQKFPKTIEARYRHLLNFFLKNCCLLGVFPSHSCLAFGQVLRAWA